jgi:plasmid stability protein
LVIANKDLAIATAKALKWNKIELEQRAAQHGRTIELEIKAILKSVLAPKKLSNIDLATAINRRFADFGDFEIPEIPREPMRPLPTFDL